MSYICSMQPESFIPQIISSLSGSNVLKIILFGSYAYGNPTNDSDIDIMVVTDDQFIPRSFKEKMDLKVAISRKLSGIREFFPIDLIVHTDPMHRRFLELGSQFSLEIASKGKLIYERPN